MSRYSRVYLYAAPVALLLASGVQVQASGFQLREQSASGQGVSYAGISAGGSDISAMFYNPAILTRYDGNQLNLGFTDINPSTVFSAGAASRSGIPASSPFSTISGPSGNGNAAQSAVTPTLYAMWSATRDLKLGVSVNVPYGLTTQYDNDWIGRYRALRSHLQTMDLTPTAAYHFSDHWSGGVSFVARQAKAELSQAIDLGYEAYAAVSAAGLNNTNPQTGAPIVFPGAADGSVFVSGQSWAYSYKAGLLYEPTKALHLGLGYQSAIKENLKGTATFTVPSSVAAGLAGLAEVNPAQTAVVTAMGQALAAGTADGPVTAQLNMPSMLSLGAAYDVSPTLTLSAEVQRTMWSTFSELRVKFSDPTIQPDSYTTEDWQDTTFVSLGATCHPGNGWTYRLGVAMDKAPVEDAYRTPRIPDADRTWLSAGLSYQFLKGFGVDFGYTHIIAKDSTVNLSGGTDPTAPSFFEGSLTGTFKNSIDIWAIQAHWSF